MAWVLAADDVDAGEVPEWVRGTSIRSMFDPAFVDRWAPDPLPPAPDWWGYDTSKPGMPRRPAAEVEQDWRRHSALRAHRRAVEAWCAECGYSYCRTILGWRRPSPSERAAGQVGVPRRAE